MGGKFAVVIDKQSIADEMFKKKGIKTSGRLATRATETMFQNKDLVFAQYEERWRFFRKFTHSALFNPAQSQNFKIYYDEAINSLTKNLKDCSKSGTPVVITKEFSTMTNELIVKLLFGRHMKKESTHL